MPNFGEQFLHQKDPKLHTTQPVEHEQSRRRQADLETSQKPDVKLHDWMQVLEQTHASHRDDPRVLERIRDYYHDQYVISEDNIPESYFDNQKRLAREQGHGDIEITDQMRDQLSEVIISDQRSTLDKWLEYLTSKDADSYPMWAKYWSFTNMVKLSTFDKEKHAFSKRDKDTVAPFPDLNREALAYVVDAVIKQVGKEKQDTDPEFQKLLTGANFGKLYAWAIEKVTPTEENELVNTKGEWLKYKRGSDHMPLVESLQGHGTGWCTAGESTAQAQLSAGDFYVYYSYDKDGKPSIPRVAIRMQEGGIAEVRGIAPDQNLDPYIGDVVKAKLAEFPDGKIYEQKSQDMKLLTEIDNKQKAGQALTSDDLRFLYEIDHKIEGFGYQRDPRIQEVLQTRDPKQDAPIVFECDPSEIAWNQAEVSENTKAYIGPLYPGIFQRDFEYIYTSFPEKRIRQKQITIGDKTKDQLKAEIQKKNIETTQWPQVILDKAKIVPLEKSEQMELVILTVVDLGFSQGATTKQIYTKARELGLELCPAEVGLQLRLQYDDQPKGEYLHVGMEPIFGAGGGPRVFLVGRNHDGKRWLYAYDARPVDRWYPDYLWAFARRKSL